MTFRIEIELYIIRKPGQDEGQAMSSARGTEKMVRGDDFPKEVKASYFTSFKLK